MSWEDGDEEPAPPPPKVPLVKHPEQDDTDTEETQ